MQKKMNTDIWHQHVMQKAMDRAFLDFMNSIGKPRYGVRKMVTRQQSHISKK